MNKTLQHLRREGSKDQRSDETGNGFMEIILRRRRPKWKNIWKNTHRCCR